MIFVCFQISIRSIHISFFLSLSLSLSLSRSGSRFSVSFFGSSKGFLSLARVVLQKKLILLLFFCIDPHTTLFPVFNLFLLQSNNSHILSSFFNSHCIPNNNEVMQFKLFSYIYLWVLYKCSKNVYTIRKIHVWITV